ncbi:murein L,D-transpeptidase family protein [Marinifilum sp. D714]|uniref:L,D-transpeptidase family protein n=1 Tax=Marinifilum sp. D714 TaxID=2937523 RepID=UPI0027C157D2|nr:L,D-transpeptidase family protein [Marinifilum sp. D714]MDQ2180777.1 L,D-transpeptidase family protein [Marinifilum sp. D714]
MKLVLTFILVLQSISMSSSFKSQQLKYPRVREACAEKENDILKLLDNKSIKIDELEVYLRAFKFGQKIQLWGKNKSDQKFKLIKEYKVCRKSGKLGPKRKQGDLQVPEGFYYIDRFNPASNFHLSLGINYPNQSDLFWANKTNPGGDIFIHGSCVTVGCLPITDDQIKELYIFCVEAKNNGQQKIPVHIFPVKLSNKNFDVLVSKYKEDQDKITIWKDLKNVYDSFNKTRQIPKVTFLNNGKHLIESKQ